MIPLQSFFDQLNEPRWAVYSNQSKMADGNPFPFPVHEATGGNVCDWGNIHITYPCWLAEDLAACWNHSQTCCLKLNSFHIFHPSWY